MHHVFGLIIPDFSFTEKVSTQMKGDYLMLAHTWRELEEQGDTCIFYIVAMNMDIAIKLKNLREELKHKGFLKMQFMTPDEIDYTAYFKKNNIRVNNFGGILSLEGGQKMTNQESERMARAVGKRCLKRQLAYREEGIKEVKDKFLMPGNINWNFYGTRKG